MTNEEVRDRLDIIITKHEIDDENVTITNEKDYDAIRMAIKSLEQQTCEDAISRQAVEEIINDIRDCISVDGYWTILERLKKLPSVSPQPKVGYWIEDEYEMKVWCSACGEENDKCSKYCPNCGSYNGGNENVT